MKCEICGNRVNNTIAICKNCLIRAADNNKEMVYQIKQIADVLSITANTDSNIKNAMESLIALAKEMEVEPSGRGKEKEKKEV